MGARTWFTGAAAMAAISVMLPPATPAQTSRAGIVTTLKGTATVARTSAPEPTPLKFRDDVFVQDRITTGEQSIARILLGGKAVITIRERSNLTITETATSSTIEMTSGKIALSVDKSRVKAGESVEIKTPNAVAAIRGTIIVAEVDPPSAESPEVSTRFTLLTGVVDVTRVDPATGRLSGAAIVMKPMQALGVTGFTAVPLPAPRPITRVEADTAASGFSVRLPDPSPGANAKVIDDQVTEAAKRTAKIAKDTKVDALPGRNDDKVAAKDDGDRNERPDRSAGPASGGAPTNGGGPASGTVASVASSTGSLAGSVTGPVTTGTVRTGNGNNNTTGIIGGGNTLIGGIADKLPKKDRTR